MKLIPTFCDSSFHGFDTMQDIIRLKEEAHEIALVKQETENADHMIYGYFSLDKNGDIETARLYSGLPKTEEEFEAIASLENTHIYAIHRHN